MPFRVCLYELIAPEATKCVMRSRPALSPPENGCADWASVGHFGGILSVYAGSFSRGESSAFFKSAKVDGIEKGSFCGGILGGSGGSWVGVGSVSRGRSRSGSKPLRNVVYTLGRSAMLS